MGTDRGFDAFYEETFDSVFRAACLMTRDVAQAEEATQEAFARALMRWERLKTEEWAAAWVMTTALNYVRKTRRRHQKPHPAEILSESDPEMSLDLWAALRQLPRRQLEAVLLHYMMDLSVVEAAQVMGCRDGTVKAHLAQARHTLARILGGERVDR